MPAEFQRRHFIFSTRTFVRARGSVVLRAKEWN
jgi:hypothetical protein